MRSAPRVSIITPAYNAAEHLRETADSVLCQTFTDWEWIIVDDGSTDETRDVVENISDPRVRLIEASHSGLPAIARNLGVEESSGEYVAFLDADDLWLPEKLEVQLERFQSNPEVGLVFSKVRHMYDEIGRIGRSVHDSTLDAPNPGFVFRYLCFRNFVCTSSVTLRKDLLLDYGVMNEDPRHRGTEDYELWLRLAPHTQFAWVEKPVVIYRVAPTSLSHGAVFNAQGRILALESALQRNPGLGVHPELEGDGMEAWKLFWLGHSQLRDGVEDCGMSALWRSIRIRPSNGLAWAWLAISFLRPSWQRRLRRFAYRLV